ncbi:hypothetical protein QYF61_006249 [Mycteria americana]|uniref:CLEC16A/TT9 C-terminal domain-containing protein n=1 Tax=Mycteria americana TaxID=33587 RepID=A0AAN7NM46_MYCAM|nr:hypothetical protein QYF61_006249 [Mycteria americana]
MGRTPRDGKIRLATLELGCLLLKQLVFSKNGSIIKDVHLACLEGEEIFLDMFEDEYRSMTAAFQPLFPKPVVLHGVVVTQVQDLALSLVEPHTTGPSPSIQPVQVPLQSLPPLKQINTPTQLGVVCKLPEGALDPFVEIIDKDIKQN